MNGQCNAAGATGSLALEAPRPPRERFRLTLGLKRGLLFAFFMMATAGNLHVARSMFDGLDSSTHIVNDTGRLRYLSQKIAYLATRLDNADRGMLRVQIKDYALTLADVERHLQGEGQPLLEHAPELLASLDSLRREWQGYARAVSVIVASDLADVQTRHALSYLHRTADTILVGADDIANAIIAADRQVRQRINRTLFGMLAIEGALLLCVLAFMQCGASRPIRRLAGMRHGCTAGEHAGHTQLPARDEAGDLARSFKRTAEITAELIQNRIDARQAQAHLISVMENLANYDSLTGLPNRALLRDRLEQALAVSHRRRHLAAVIYLDLDRFKTVNDTLGHDTGDCLLQEVARRLGECLREGDTLARLGGDEFVAILPDREKDGDVDALADRLSAALAAPFFVGTHELFVSGSLGISLYPRDGTDGATLLRHADIAMYRAKDEGRNSRRYFAAEMNVRAHERLILENSLRHAIERDEFVLHYQPQVDGAGGRIVGMEALVRWRHPELGMVPPARFIPLAEETGLIVEIGEWVLRTACAQNRAWQANGLPALRVAVNLSARQFRQRDVVKLVTDVLRATGLDGKHLDLELTESMLMHAPEETIPTLAALKQLGVHIALDDFGTGYSSLAYLQRFPIDEIKIDQSFVRDIGCGDAPLVQAILGLARGLALGVVAEGVETAEQYRYLQHHGCERMQGYLFSRPVPAEEMARLLAADARLDPAVRPNDPGQVSPDCAVR